MLLKQLLNEKLTFLPPE